MKSKGRCVVHAQVQGHDFPVTFKDMETELPILSVRKIARRGNDVGFREKDGWIENRKTKKIMKFYSHEGGYFIKLKVTDPSLLMDVDESDSGSDFHRPGR